MKTKGLAAPKDDMRRIEVEQALHTITEAERHRHDPRMMADVAKLAAEKKQHLGRIARMKPPKTPTTRKK